MVYMVAPRTVVPPGERDMPRPKVTARPPQQSSSQDTTIKTRRPGKGCKCLMIVCVYVFVYVRVLILAFINHWGEWAYTQQSSAPYHPAATVCVCGPAVEDKGWRISQAECLSHRD